MRLDLKLFFSSFTRNIKALLYPMKCLGCGIYIDPENIVPNTLENCFCDSCMDRGFYPIQRPYCTKCGLQLAQSHKDNHVCGTCIKNPLDLLKVRAVSEYKGVIKEGISLLKYQSKLSLATVFESLLFETFVTHFDPGIPDDSSCDPNAPAIDLIMPIPLHASRLRERGFNQAYLLVRNFKKLYARQFGKQPIWKLDVHSLTRKKNTASQTGFDVDVRKQNLENAFFIQEPATIQNKSILLVDDVFTTGATCNEAAALLIKKGAKTVQAIVLARA